MKSASLKLNNVEKATGIPVMIFNEKKEENNLIDFFNIENICINKAMNDEEICNYIDKLNIDKK